MGRFRLAALIVAGVFSFSGSAAYAQVCLWRWIEFRDGKRLGCRRHAGYNWQQGPWVYGLETDLSGTGLKTSMSGGLVSPCTGDFASTIAKVDWYGTFRGRAGWIAGNFFFYGTGGLAYGHVDLSSTYHECHRATECGYVVGEGRLGGRRRHRISAAAGSHSQFWLPICRSRNSQFSRPIAGSTINVRTPARMRHLAWSLLDLIGGSLRPA